MNLPDKEILKYTHKPGYTGLYRISKKGKVLKSLWFPLTFSLLTVSIIAKCQKDLYDLIISFIDIIFSVIPNLLGFVLGGYAIFVGFGGEGFLKAASEISSEKPVSLYQTLSSIFALNLLTQSATLVTALCIYFISKFCIIIPVFWANIFNSWALFILVFLTCYSIFQIPNMIKNVFSISQAYHLFLINEKYKGKDKKDNN